MKFYSSMDLKRILLQQFICVRNLRVCLTKNVLVNSKMVQMMPKMQMMLDKEKKSHIISIVDTLTYSTVYTLNTCLHNSLLP